MTRRARVVAALLVGVLALTGCAGSTGRSAADELPSLRQTLSKVDDALAAHRYGLARKYLRQLVAEVRRGRSSGVLDDASASDILRAANVLLDVESPQSTPTSGEASEGPSSSPSKTPRSNSTRSPSKAPTPQPRSTPTASQPPVPSSTPTAAPSTDPGAEKSSGAPEADPTPTAAQVTAAP